MTTFVHESVREMVKKHETESLRERERPLRCNEIGVEFSETRKNQFHGDLSEELIILDSAKSDLFFQCCENAVYY